MCCLKVLLAGLRYFREMTTGCRVAQIVGTWARRAEKVEEERENGRKWREREGERERGREGESSTPVKYNSVLLRNVKVRYFLSQNVKIWYFLSQNVKIRSQRK